MSPMRTICLSATLAICTCGQAWGQTATDPIFNVTDGTRTLYLGCDVNEPWLGTPTNNDLRVITNGLERMRVTKTGGVGIGGSCATDIKLAVTFPGAASPNNVLRLSGNNGWLGFNVNSSGGAFNPLVSSGDKTLIFSDGALDSGRLFFGPHSANAKGLLLDGATGAVVVGADPGGPDTLRVGGPVCAGTTGNSTTLGGPFIELGGSRATGNPPADQYTLIDFHSAASGQSDYSARIIRFPGVNGRLDINNVGNGALTLSTGVQARLYIDATSGNVGIGTNSPTTALAVNGTIRAKEVRVEATPWPDFVFDSTYRLAPLSEVATYIKTNKHLPGIPAASEVEKDGMGVSDMVTKQMTKIEELTLYAIDLHKTNDRLSQANDRLTQDNADLKVRVEAIERALGLANR